MTVVVTTVMMMSIDGHEQLAIKQRVGEQQDLLDLQQCDGTQRHNSMPHALHGLIRMGEKTRLAP